MERICGEIRLADFDHLDLSNMNRLSASLIDIGLNKCIIAARAISEIDPFIKVDVFSEGISNLNIDSFLTANGNVDILIEECDSLEIKFLARFKAREHKIPVIMETNDKGMIDIERFDIDPERQIFHGVFSEKELNELSVSVNPMEKLSVIKKLIDFPNTSKRLKNSFEELGKTIGGLPQLSSSIYVGAGSLTNICRRILLGTFKNSGRYYFDIEIIVPDNV